MENEASLLILSQLVKFHEKTTFPIHDTRTLDPSNQSVMRACEKQQLKQFPLLGTPCITSFAVQYKEGFCHSSLTVLLLYRATDCFSQLAESSLETQRGSQRISGAIQIW